MKRKFKILILAISVIAMLLAFSITSSASQLANEDELFISVGHFGGEFEDVRCFFTTNPTMFTYNDFRIIVVDSCSFSDGDNYYSYYLIGVEAFYNEITANVSSPNVEGEIHNYLCATYDYNCDSALYYYGHVLYQEAHEYMNRVTQEDLEAKYSEGKLAGVEEFKNSEEYTNTINLAKSAGVDEYKASDEYASALNSKYNEGHISGTAAGITAYKSSTEYKKALSAEYDEGYDAGFEEGENSFDFTPIVVGIIVLATIAIALLIVNKKRKKSYR